MHHQRVALATGSAVAKNVDALSYPSTGGAQRTRQILKLMEHRVQISPRYSLRLISVKCYRMQQLVLLQLLFD